MPSRRDNPTLKGVLPKDYARPGLDKQRLGQLINLVSDIGLGSPADRAKDILGRVYEYFLAQFASAEGKKGGQFYTPSRVVRVLVEMLAPYKGRVYDPCCVVTNRMARSPVRRPGYSTSATPRTTTGSRSTSSRSSRASTNAGRMLCSS